MEIDGPEPNVEVSRKVRTSGIAPMAIARGEGKRGASGAAHG
jgi:hypothetical protein